MVAVIIERFNKSLKECFGVDSVNDIPVFDTTLGYFLNYSSSDVFEKVVELPSCKDALVYNKSLTEFKNLLKKQPSETVAVTFSDVFIEMDKIKKILKENNENLLLVNAEKEKFLCIINAEALLTFLAENNDDIMCVFGKIKAEITCDNYVKVFNNPLKYKDFCDDVLKGAVDYRLPELAQGIYVSSNIPEGDFVLIPPVYLGDDIQIEKGSVIGPFTVVSDGCLVARNSRVRKSFLGVNSYISTGCHIEGSLLSDNVVLRRNSVVFNGSVLCHDVTVGEEKIVDNHSFIRAFCRVDEYDIGLVNYKHDFSNSADGFYGYTPEKAALLGAATGVCYDMPRIAVACDGEMNSTALKLAFLGGLITTGAACYDFGNTFFSSLHYFMDFCELDCGVFISGNDGGTVIRIFKRGSTELSRSDFYNIKSIISSGVITRCDKKDCKSIRQIHGMQRMYIQYLTSLFTEKIKFTPVFRCDNKRILSVVELAAAKIGFKTGKNRVIFNINPLGTRVSAQSNGVVYPYSKLLEAVSFHQRKNNVEYSNKIFENDSIVMTFLLIKILNDKEVALQEIVENLPRFYVAEKTVDNSCELKVLAADLSRDNKIDFKKDEIFYCDGINTVKINDNQKGGLSIRAKAHSMEAATEIIDTLTRLIRGDYSY